MGCCCKKGPIRTPNRKLTPEEEQTFRLEMQEHGNQGVLLSELEEELQETVLLETIHRDRLRKLLQQADKDGDHFITETEIMDMYATQLTANEKWAWKAIVGPVISNIEPWRNKYDFLANYDCRPPPIFMIIITVIELGVFIWYAVELKAQGTPVTATDGYPMNSPFVYKADRRYEAWRFLSYLLVHSGYEHIVSNLCIQLALGVPLEIVHEWWRVLILYVCGVLGGSLAHSVTDHDVNLVGASGGAYALLGAHLGSIVVNWKEMNYKCRDRREIWRCLLSAPVRLGIILLLACTDTGVATYRRFFSDSAGNTTGISAHIGGLATGVLLGIPILKNVHELPWEKRAGIVSMCIYLVCVAFAIIFNGVYQGYPATDWNPCC